MNENQSSDKAFSGKDVEATVASVASDIRTAAKNKFGEAMTETRSRADDAKAGVADEVKDVADALRRASEELRGGSAQERTLGTIAGSLADASDSIRDKDLGEIAQMANRVARENPILFLGGAALLGFAVSRYAKASGHSAGGAMSRKPADSRSPVNQFVDEGNPNTQPVSAAT